MIFEADQILDSNGNALNQIKPFNGKNPQSFYKADPSLKNFNPNPTPGPSPDPSPGPSQQKSSSIEILSLNSFFVLEVIVSLVFVGLVYARS